MGPKGRITIKILELLGCVACLLYKIFTDHEARQLFFLNQKLSREWSLLNNITWSNTGNAFANITYGGYTLIIALMVISRCIDARSKPTVLEKIFLTVGVIMFFGMGGLVFAALDQVPVRLQDNAIILGCMSFLVGILFLIDLTDPLRTTMTETTQTDNIIETGQHHGRATDQRKNIEQRADITSIHDLPIFENEPAPAHRSSQDTPDRVVQSVSLPVRQSPVFERINPGPERMYATRQQSVEPQPPHPQWYHQEHEMVPMNAPKYRTKESLYQENRAYISDTPVRRSQHHNPHQLPHIPIRQMPPNPNRHSSYVQGSVVDNENFILKKKENSPGCCSHSSGPPTRSITNLRNDDEPAPITRGYVSNVAKMWENRAMSKSNPLLGMQTNV